MDATNETATQGVDLLKTAGVDDRAIYWCLVMLAVAAATCACGTIILMLGTWRSKLRTPAALSLGPDSPRSGTALPSAQSIGTTTIGVQDVHVSADQPLRAPQVRQAISERRRGRQLLGVFLVTFALCLVFVIAGIVDGSLSKETGLAWESYAALLSLGCIWMLLQAVIVASTLETGRGYGAGAFAEAMLGGVCPFIADSFDTLKDTMFGGLCLKSSHVFLNVVGICSWMYLFGFHIYFFTQLRFVAELVASHLAIFGLPTLDVTKSAPKMKISEKLTALAAKQISPTKRHMLEVENLPQAGFAILYLAVEGGSPVVALLSLALPTLQIAASCALHGRIQRRLVPWYAMRFEAAMNDADEVLARRLWSEIDVNEQLCLKIALSTRCFGDVLHARRRHRAELGHVVVEGGEDEDARIVCRRLMRSAESGKVHLHEVTNWDVPSLEALLRLVSQAAWVRELSLRDCQLDGPSLAPALSDGLRGIRHLKELRLSDNPQLGNEGAQALAAALFDCGLESLWLHSTGVGSEGAEALRRALEEGGTALKHLSLRVNDAVGEEAKAALRACCESRGIRLSM
ncbi:NLRC3 [Symbiodinium natans]|uniref:NLRC3 protein n=1 Tax=Symbiodinium natans TaxID=878477 RepID=A0A812NXD6_9DINO|nr:NLRC3 [Symbiodinium natans]